MCLPYRSFIGRLGEKASEGYCPYWLFLPPGSWRARNSGREERKGGLRFGEEGNGYDTEHTRGSRKPIGWAITECFWHQIKLYVKVSLCKRL